jgi:hypothetical protein
MLLFHVEYSLTVLYCRPSCLMENTIPVRYSEGSIIRRFDIPRVRYSEGSIFRRFDIPKVRYSEGTKLSTVVNPVTVFPCVIVGQNCLIDGFVEIHRQR